MDNANKVWEAIKAMHMGADRVKEARLQTLMSDFERLKMKDTDTIDDFVGKISEIASKSSSLGENIEESKLVRKFPSSLPRKKYIHIVASLEKVLDLKTISFEDNIGCLKAYEERVGEDEEDKQETQSKLLYSNMEGQQTQRSYNGDFRNKRRGGRFYNRGRGRGRTYRELDLS